MIEIRPLTTMKELQQLQEVEAAVWDMAPIPVHQTFTVLNHGGVILGAFDGDKMVGFLNSFPGFAEGKVYLCSHMLGILPEYRKSGLGRDMKNKQAEVARNTGYDLITWTFDPLESLNAFFNIQKLKAKGVAYKENHYGAMDDDLNQGLPTDRIQIEWDLHEQNNDRNVHFEKESILLDKDGHGQPTMFAHRYEQKAGPWFLAVPENFQTIKQEDFQRAREWRYQTRKVFQTLFNDGYQAKGVIRGQESQTSYYMLER
ncbi:GNAT family N-acetyltransferase [Natribacillus halophilus]|uniref:Predicted acetyltransferase, GNAT superfamily n=1 Tax=Natribacillus halophilus TaxID=549003 RepID=A0A1G8MV94_9BACI|nr:GNAT family N-acetyltransferase [Natribacillus halophilus]SDI71793.1 Predicted acetyltransferase, GNAT superfamily [Natribacillus halophilus]